MSPQTLSYLTGALSVFGKDGNMPDKAPDGLTKGHMGKALTPTKYSTVRGFFKQADPGFNSTGYDLLSDSFGLIEEGSQRWSDFHKHIAKLNAEADEHTTYKLVYLARHGQGYHNVAETKYGTPAWDAYWSRLNGDGEIVWGPDPMLTPLGISQAEAVNAAWKEQIKADVPLPTRLYSSPLTRSAKTLEITWHDILLHKGLRPLIHERLRETIGLHTCDKRSDKTVIRERFPRYDIEPGFSEHDQLWGPDYQETAHQQALRIQQQLNENFATDPSTYISITAHGGVINAFFAVVGHPPISVLPGGFVPIVVKAVDYRDAEADSYAGGQSVHAGPLQTPQPSREL